MNSASQIASLFARALKLHQSGQLPEAEQIYRQILSFNRRHADSLHLLGMLAYQCGHSEAATRLINEAIAAKPDEALYHSNLGVVLNSLGHLDQAVNSYQQALKLRPDYTEARSNLGNVLVAQGNYADAISHLERVLVLNPDHAETHTNLGVALAEQGNTNDAIPHYRRAIALKPDSAEAFSNLGNALQAHDKLDEAIACYQRALSLKPDYLTALYNLGNAYQSQDKLPDAFAAYDRALAFQPDYANAIYGKALGQLLAGDFVSGWKNYESRWQSVAQKTMRPYRQPRWQGERLSAGKLLIWGEQGVGDEIMFAGLLPDVLRSGNACILDCDARLKPLFARSFPGIEVVSGSAAIGDFAAHQPIASLPGLFRNSHEAFAFTSSPYLKPDPVKRQYFLDRYACGKRLIGVAWYTKNRNTGPSRSIELSLLAPLFKQTDAFWVSLQYGEFEELNRQTAKANAAVFIDREVDQFTDLDAFAAQISALDLVITIDNSTAHLAGALGVPVWVLLPFARDWRWQQARSDSPWYPSMRLFRQPSNGDWKTLVSEVIAAMPDRALRDE